MSSFNSAQGPSPDASGTGGGPRPDRGLLGGIVSRPRSKQTDATHVTPVTPRGGVQTGPHEVPEGLRVASGYAWRVIVLALAVYLVFVVVAKVAFVAVAVFVGLVISALLRPVVDLFARVLPRALAVAGALLLTIVLVGGVFTFITNSVAGQSASLADQFSDGLANIERSLAGSPLHLQAVDLNTLGQQARVWVSQNGGALAGHALGGAGVAVEVLTGFVLGVFCSIFFLTSGDRIWAWLLGQAGGDRHRWDAAARAGWGTFAGYTRGVVIIAATNAALVCIALLILRVPLALPLALLVFFAAFIPLIGSPVALAVATLVALAARGPLIALLVLVLIVVIGQIEGNLLHPMVMSRAVNLHPLVVALAVACGTVLAGVVGAVVAVPLVAVAWTIWSSLRVYPPEATERASERATDRASERATDRASDRAADRSESGSPNDQVPGPAPEPGR
jgi:predicted PurR-regulated permease PerM